MSYDPTPTINQLKGQARITLDLLDKARAERDAALAGKAAVQGLLDAAMAGLHDPEVLRSQLAHVAPIQPDSGDLGSPPRAEAGQCGDRLLEQRLRDERDEWKRKAKRLKRQRDKARAERDEAVRLAGDRANQLAQLTREREMDALTSAAGEVLLANAEADLNVARAEIARLRTVVDAARAWRGAISVPTTLEATTAIKSWPLIDAVDALDQPAASVDEPEPTTGDSTKPEHWVAPWTDEQVDGLRAWQRGDTLMHPYTCRKHTDQKLWARRQGWCCPTPGCDYEQNWAWATPPAAGPPSEAEEARRRVAEDEPAESDDEPVDAVKAAFDRGEKGVTTPPVDGPSIWGPVTEVIDSTPANAVSPASDLAGLAAYEPDDGLDTRRPTANWRAIVDQARALGRTYPTARREILQLVGDAYTEAWHIGRGRVHDASCNCDETGRTDVTRRWGGDRITACSTCAGTRRVSCEAHVAGDGCIGHQHPCPDCVDDPAAKLRAMHDADGLAGLAAYTDAATAAPVPAACETCNGTGETTCKAYECIVCPDHAAPCPACSATSDEPVDAVKAAFDRGEKGVTAPPRPGPDLARHLRSAGWCGQFTPGGDQ